jgi:hypothetical protein
MSTPEVTLHQLIPPLPAAQIDVTIRVTSQLNVTAFSAKQKVAGLALSEIGTGISADEPELVVSRQRVVWRVPLQVALPDLGRVGGIGTIDVDAQTGEVLADHRTYQSLIQRARQLAPADAR